MWRGGLELRNVLNINKEFSGKLRSKKVLKTLCKTNVLGRFVGTFGTSPPPPVANIFRKNFRFPEEGPKFLNSPPPPPPNQIAFGTALCGSSQLVTCKRYQICWNSLLTVCWPHRLINLVTCKI